MCLRLVPSNSVFRFKSYIKKSRPRSKHTYTDLEVYELYGPGLDHGAHGVDQVVHERVDAVLLVEGDGAHGLLPHGTLVGVPENAFF